MQQLPPEAFRLLAEFYHIVEAGGHVLSEASSRRAQAVVRQFLQKQNRLAMIYWHRRVPHYNVTFKSHLFWHMGEQCRFWNPRHGWAYKDESFVGSVARVVHSVCTGASLLSMGHRLAAKWKHLQSFRLRRRQGAVFA